jgi:hypothetical protein
LQPLYASTMSNKEVIKTLGLILTMVEDYFPKLLKQLFRCIYIGFVYENKILNN